MGRVSEEDRKHGYYWQLPDGEKQNRCPRHHIREDPEWWDALITAYNGYQNGLLPHSGGLSDQPALYMTLMSIIADAQQEEAELEKLTDQDKRNLVDASNDVPSGPRSLLHG